MTAFDPKARRILVTVHVTGPRTTLDAMLLLDTGATTTLIRTSILLRTGLKLGPNSPQRRFRSATGSAMAPIVVAPQLLALGEARADFPVAAHDFPPAVTFDGLLGLDFLRGRLLTLDFARGRVGLRQPRTWRPWG
ncbi:MAG TPA: retropepsin-like aspartic protease [Urbifossiella sp.]|nr:retropepsin-like aspartic protease [Urbifossiella sp.]